MVASCILDCWNGLHVIDNVSEVCCANFAVLSRGTNTITMGFFLVFSNGFCTVKYCGTVVRINSNFFDRYQTITLMKMTNKSPLKLKTFGELGRNIGCHQHFSRKPLQPDKVIKNLSLFITGLFQCCG